MVFSPPSFNELGHFGNDVLGNTTDVVEFIQESVKREVLSRSVVLRGTGKGWSATAILFGVVLFDYDDHMKTIY